MTYEKQRDNSIDFARGIGVFLVIAGHMPSVFSGSVRAWIFTFHMPLFIVISGYFWRPTVSEWLINHDGGRLDSRGAAEDCSLDHWHQYCHSARVKMRRSAKALLVPYVVYSTVFMLLDFLITGFTGVTIYSGESSAFGTGFHLQAAAEQLARHLHSFLAGQGGGDEALWFFPCLFLVQLFYLTAELISGKLTIQERKRVLGVIVVLLTASGWLCGRAGVLGFWKIGSALYSVGYFAIGRGLRVFHQRNRCAACETGENRVPVKYLMVVLTSCLAINLLIFFASWRLTGNAGMLDINSNTCVDLIFTYAAALAGCLALLAFSRWICRLRAIRQLIGIIAYVGRNSLYFYPISDYIPGVVKILLPGKLAQAGKILAFAIPWAVAEIMGRHKTCRHLEDKAVHPACRHHEDDK